MPTLPAIHNPRKTKQRTQVRQAKQRAQRRLYATDHPTWRKIRANQLRHEPLCRECYNNGRITAANVVDHINRDTYNNSEANLQSLCKKCHDTKTGKETGFKSQHGFRDHEETRNNMGRTSGAAGAEHTQ